MSSDDHWRASRLVATSHPRHTHSAYQNHTTLSGLRWPSSLYLNRDLPIGQFLIAFSIICCSGTFHWPVSKGYRKFHWPGISLLWYCLPDRMEPYLAVFHCYDLDKLIVKVIAVLSYSVMISSNCYSGRTQQIDKDDDFMSFFHIMFYETPLCISSGFCELGASPTLSTRACCVTSAELTIKKTQRQLQSENFIIYNLKRNFHHTDTICPVYPEEDKNSTLIWC